MVRRIGMGLFGAGAILIGLAGWTPVPAHMPYLLPSVFDATGRKAITLTASFTEDTFRPEIAMADAPFEITAPDGRTTRLAAPMLAREVTLVDAPLPAGGIYRVSSGQRLGRWAGCITKAASGRSWPEAPPLPRA